MSMENEILKPAIPNSSNSKENWKSPTSIIAIIGLIVSLCGNLYQYFSSEKKLEFEKQKWESEFSLAENKWQTEKQKLEADLQEFKNIEAHKEGLKIELEKVNKDIAVWDNAIFQDENELTLMKGKLSNMTTGPIKDAQIENIKLQEGMIKRKNSELQKCISRRTELESSIK